MENNFELEGIITSISSEKTRVVSDDKFFYKQVILVENKEHYPQRLAFEIKPKLYSQFVLGETIIVKFNIFGYEYKGKLYNRLLAWCCIRFGKEPEKYIRKVQQMKERAASKNYKHDNTRYAEPKTREQLEEDEKETIDLNNLSF